MIQFDNAPMKKLFNNPFSLFFNINWLLLIICFFCTSCENSEQELNTFTQKKIGVEEATDVNILYSTDGQAKAQLTSSKLYRYQTDTPMVEFPKRIHVDFYDTATKIESRLDAKYAKYYESQNKIFLRDSVQLINRKGDTVNTSQLYWDQAKANFYTDKAVRVKQKDKTINGIGLTADQDFKNWTINNVQGVVLISDSLSIAP